MEIKVTVGETVKIIFDKCPRCHSNWTSSSGSKHKKTMNHTIPQFMKPQTDVLVTICNGCHAELNSHYLFDVQKGTPNYRSKEFLKFHKTYLKLRKDYNANKIKRGEFGEGLWLNLVDYLEIIQQEAKA